MGVHQIQVQSDTTNKRISLSNEAENMIVASLEAGSPDTIKKLVEVLAYQNRMVWPDAEPIEMAAFGD